MSASVSATRGLFDLGLAGVHVLITGANGGIGVPTAKLFLDQGALVTAQYNSTHSALSSDADLKRFLEAGNHGRPALHLVQCNVTDEKSVDEMFESAEQAIGQPVAVLVVNHAIYISTDAPLSAMSLDQFRKTLDVNLTGSFLCIRAYLRGLSRASAESKTREQANVVLIGSTAAEFGEAGHADYAASKSALTHGLMLSLKNEIVKIAPKGRVNTVAPGWVATPMAEESMKDENIRYQAMATTPLNKIATPYDVANQILVLASQRVSGHLTGQIIKLHGGMEGRLLNPK